MKLHVRDKVDFFPFLSRYMLQAIWGLILGVALDYVFEILTQYIKKNRKTEMEAEVKKITFLGVAFMQLFTSFLFIFAIINIFPGNMHKQWQNTVDGLAFPIFFYGTQSTMFDNIKTIYRRL